VVSLLQISDIALRGWGESRKLKVLSQSYCTERSKWMPEPGAKVEKLERSRTPFAEKKSKKTLQNKFTMRKESGYKIQEKD